MKKIYLLFAYFVCLSFTTNAQWTELTTGVIEDLSAVDFVNDQLGYIGGNGILKPTLLKTTDGGTTWTDIAPNVTGNVEDILFVSPLEGFITTSSVGNYIMKTTDGGASWTSVSTGIPAGCYGTGTLFQKNATEFYFFRNCCYYSSDGGNTWSVVSALAGCNSISFINATTGYAILQGGMTPSLLKTTDGGTTWNDLGIVCSKPLSFVHFVSNSEGYASGNNFMLKTTDGGITWNMLNNNVSQVYHIEQVGGKTFLGVYEVTTDYGATVQSIPPHNTGNFLLEASYVTNYGYFTGNDGKCLKLDLSFVNNPFYVSRNFINYVGAASTKTVQMSTAGNWSIGSLPSWVSVSPSSGSGNATLSITLQANPTDQYRSGDISLTDGSATAEITVNQVPGSAGNNWIETDTEISTQLTAIDFVNDSTGFIAGEGIARPTLLKTMDRGITWTDIAPNIKTGIQDILFLSETTGFITTFESGKTLLKTTDGGTTWNPVTSFPGANPGNLYRKNSSELYYHATTYGSGTPTYYSSDGGVTWSLVTDLADEITSISFSSPSVGYAIGFYHGYSTYLYKTTDGGATWVNMGQLNAKNPDAIYFTSDLVGYVTQANYGYVIKTVDGGLNWTVMNKTIGGNQLDFVGGRMVVGGIYLSDNEGTTCQTLTGTYTFAEASFQGTDHAYAISWSGSFYTLDLTTLANPLFVNRVEVVMSGTTSARPVQLETSGNWTATADQPWVTISPSSGSGNTTLTIQTTRNTTPYHNLAFVTISSGSYTQKIIVFQEKGTDSHDWVQLDIDNYPAFYTSVAFVSDSTGFIGGEGALAPNLLKTTDAGTTWTDVSPQLLKGYITDILFPTSTTGFITSLSDGNFLVKTTDGGATWNNVVSFPGDCAGKLYQKSSSEFFHYTCNLTYRTTDGGNTWSTITGIPTGALSISFGDNNTGYAISNSYAQQKLFKTTNGGTTWSDLGVVSAQRANSVYFISATTGYVSGDGFIIQTTDGGVTWSVANNSKGAKQLYKTGSKTFLDAAYVSNDHGVTTQTLTSLSAIFPGEACYTNNYGYVATSHGRVYRMNLSLIGAPEPLVPPTNLNFSATTQNSFQISWTKGSGSSSLVVIREASSVNQDPVDLTAYTANTAFGSGTQIGTGNYVVYAGTGNSVSVTGLNPATEYFVEVYSYNGTGTSLNYLTYQPLTGSKTTLTAEPQTASSALVFSAITETSFQLAWTKGDGNSSLVLIKQSSAVNQDPVDGTVYNANNVFGNGSTPGSGNYVVYAGTGNTVAVSGLQPGTAYHVEVIEYNGASATINYFTASTLTGAATTLAAQPAQPSTNLVISSITPNSFHLSWTNGGAESNLVLIRESNAVNEDPVNGTSYPANNSFGSGPQIGTGNYVIFSMYSSAANSVSVTGLTPGTLYYVEVFAYNGSSASTHYLTSATLTGSRSTLALEPQTPASNLLFSAVTETSFDISWTKGDGSHSLVFMKEGSPVSEDPFDGVVFPGDPVFGNGISVGIGNYVVYNGTGNTVTITGLTPDTKYYVEVYEYNGSGGSYNYLTSASLTGNQTTLAIPTSVYQYVSSEQIRLVPNPTSGMTSLEHAGIPNLTEILIVNTIGKTVATIPVSNANSTLLNTVSLESGVYFVFLKDSNKNQRVIRLIKQ